MAPPAAPAVPAALAANWRELVALLQDSEFAHGDLQHGNVMVDQEGRLRLVDFDGVWIPRLAEHSAPAGFSPPNCAGLAVIEELPVSAAEAGHTNITSTTRPASPAAIVPGASASRLDVPPSRWEPAQCSTHPVPARLQPAQCSTHPVVAQCQELKGWVSGWLGWRGLG